MGIRSHATIWGWLALIVLVVIIGCGGSFSGGTDVARFVGSWNGTMVGSDGSNTQIYVVISNTGAISWSTPPSDPNAPWPVTETGTIQNSGYFTVTGSTTATVGVTISGLLSQSGSQGGGVSTGCCAMDNLNGKGTMNNGSTTVEVTFDLTGFG